MHVDRMGVEVSGGETADRVANKFLVRCSWFHNASQGTMIKKKKFSADGTHAKLVKSSVVSECEAIKLHCLPRAPPMSRG